MKASKSSGEAKPVSARAPRAAAPKKPAVRRTAVSKASEHHASPISIDERRRMIEVCAYFRAQQRGFAPGSEQQDWYDAEAQVDALLVQPDSLTPPVGKGLG